MNVKVENQPKSTIKLTVTVPNDKVKETFEKRLDIAVEQANIEGFRKGKAPRDMVRDHVGISKLYGDVINQVLQDFYPQALKEHNIAAIANPKVEIKEFDIEKDLEFTATVAVRPEVKIGDYKKALKDHYAKRLAEVTEQNKKDAKEGETPAAPHFHLSPNEVIDVLVGQATVEVSDVLIEDETERMMARLVDQAQTIGLSIDQYLKAQNKTTEDLRKDYASIAERNLKAEFTMGKLIADTLIEADDAEIEETIKAAGFEDAEKRMQDPIEKFYVKSILQKNKLLSKLVEETEGENYHGHHDH
jgi:FKBP-type peptidyl-prolyl cis-trans isomerase (trigger factor)